MSENEIFFLNKWPHKCLFCFVFSYQSYELWKCIILAFPLAVDALEIFKTF